MKGLLAILGAGLALLLVWGVAVEPRLIAEPRVDAELPNLPAAWEGQELALLADFQTGMWFDNTGTIRRMVNRLVDRPPAAVLILGDLIYHPLGEAGNASEQPPPGGEARAKAAALITEAVSLIRPLREAGIATFVVLGNHDYGMQTRRAARLAWLAEDLSEELRAAGVTVLSNQVATLPAPGSGELLYMLGIDSHYAGRDHPAQALEGLPADAPRVIIMHNPASFPALPARAAPLALAGHTHGGQIGLPFTERWSWMSLVNPGEIHADGWATEEYGAPGNRLYVNRGIGFSVVPVRLGARPELTRLVLRAPG